MKTLLSFLILLVTLLCSFGAESDFYYVNKGYEAFYIGPYDLKIVGPDLNSAIIVSATSIDTPKYLLEADAIRIVDGLAGEPGVYPLSPQKKPKPKIKPKKISWLIQSTSATLKLNSNRLGVTQIKHGTKWLPTSPLSRLCSLIRATTINRSAIMPSGRV